MKASDLSKDMTERPLLSVVTTGLLPRVSECSMYRQIQEQIEPFGTKVEYFALIDNGPMSTGAKVGVLFDLCSGRYIARVDDDDRIADDYVAALLEAIEQHDVDVVTFDHSYSVDGKMTALTKQIPNCEQKMHDKKPRQGFEVHERLPGILCPVRAELAKQFKHPDISEKEDYAYKDFIRVNAKTYHNIDRVLYHHLWKYGNKRHRAALQWKWGRH